LSALSAAEMSLVGWKLWVINLAPPTPGELAEDILDPVDLGAEK